MDKGQNGGFVKLKTDCPHVAALHLPSPLPAIDRRAACALCGDSRENWLCLTCLHVHCSRYVNGHAQEHSADSGHPLAITLHDLHTWCYHCSSYVDHHCLRAVEQALNRQPYPRNNAGSPPPPDIGGLTINDKNRASPAPVPPKQSKSPSSGSPQKRSPSKHKHKGKAKRSPSKPRSPASPASPAGKTAGVERKTENKVKVEEADKEAHKKETEKAAKSPSSPDKHKHKHEQKPKHEQEDERQREMEEETHEHEETHHQQQEEHADEEAEDIDPEQWGSGHEEEEDLEQEEEEEEEEEESDPDDNGESHMRQLLREQMAAGAKLRERPRVLDTLDLDGVVKYIQSGQCRRIIVMAGAGISVSCGIPDFRTPGTGLYDNLQKYNLPEPTAVFDIDFFRENPEPFYQLSKELFPGTFLPSITHYFIKLLADKGLLLRHYTQNIDMLERVAGLDPDLLVEAHGSFSDAFCISCKTPVSVESVRDAMMNDQIPRCRVPGCGGLVKPAIVFFGENLPARFFDLMREDFPKADLLITMGTSLVVQPFASLISAVTPACPRMLINNEEVGSMRLRDPLEVIFGLATGSFLFGRSDNYRDVFLQGSCDAGVRTLAERLGWGGELEEMRERGRRDMNEVLAKQGKPPLPSDEEIEERMRKEAEAKLEAKRREQERQREERMRRREMEEKEGKVMGKERENENEENEEESEHDHETGVGGADVGADEFEHERGHDFDPDPDQEQGPVHAHAHAQHRSPLSPASPVSPSEARSPISPSNLIGSNSPTHSIGSPSRAPRSPASQVHRMSD